ncbi:hypothetical protein C8F04DRAFT_1274910 [Mycena alexandri]|uniref:Uncharacterized protein n=1 Tax=Mycena alexandri TaxID=1745969 RepID=A0AAD6WR23_9AGAR|nr:hypothetical protein C8F04DRAFT_1274910 [Mycena alexandri]
MVWLSAPAIPFDTSTMVPAIPLLRIILEFVVAFFGASAGVLAILHLADISFPLLDTLQITLACTCVVFAAMRAAGRLWVLGGESESHSCSIEDDPALRSSAEFEEKKVFEMV